jgi:hypothetical protein
MSIKFQSESINPSTFLGLIYLQIWYTSKLRTKMLLPPHREQSVLSKEKYINVMLYNNRCWLWEPHEHKHTA